VVADEMEARRRDEGSELFQKLAAGADGKLVSQVAMRRLAGG